MEMLSKKQQETKLASDLPPSRLTMPSALPTAHVSKALRKTKLGLEAELRAALGGQASSRHSCSMRWLSKNTLQGCMLQACWCARWQRVDVQVCDAVLRRTRFSKSWIRQSMNSTASRWHSLRQSGKGTARKFWSRTSRERTRRCKIWMRVTREHISLSR